MKNYFKKLQEDVRFQEGLNACINCGTCTAICPAAEFYRYDPRQIADVVQSRNDDEIETLLKSDTIWYCGECMSCKTRCPRGNAPGLIIIALRSLSQDTGLFIHSEKGRQQLAVKRTVGENILKTGYCVYPGSLMPSLHPEQGPVWEWELENIDHVMHKLGANYNGEGAGALRKIPEESLKELKAIFDETGATDRWELIEKISAEKANDMGLTFDETMNCSYFKYIYKHNSRNHFAE